MTNKLTNKNYIAIADWMLDLGLNTRELLTYALIYSFSQDQESCYYGSLEYLAEWLDIDSPHSVRYLKPLVDKKLVTKEDIKVAGKTRCCKYKTIEQRGNIIENPDVDYIIIQPWMIKNMHLNGKDLLLYALIHGYSRKGSNNYCSCQKDYFAKWLQCRKDNVQRQINQALNKGYIKPYEDGYIAIVPENINFPQNGSITKKIKNTQTGSIKPQTGSINSLKVVDNNLYLQTKENLLETDSQEEINYFKSMENKNISLTDEEMFSKLTKTQLKALNILVKKIAVGEIEATKESLYFYFKKLVLRKFKTQKGEQIRNIVGYVESNFKLKTQNDDFVKNLLTS